MMKCCCPIELTCILKAETNCEKEQREGKDENYTTQKHPSAHFRIKWLVGSMKQWTYWCLVTPPSHNGRGWRTRCRTSGRRRTGRTWRAWVHFCGGRASATAEHKSHEGNLSFLPPEEREHSIITTLPSTVCAGLSIYSQGLPLYSTSICVLSSLQISYTVFSIVCYSILGCVF